MSDSLEELRLTLGEEHMIYYKLQRDYDALQKVLSGDTRLEELLMREEAS